MEIDFQLRGVGGRVTVRYERNDDPMLVGAAPSSRGFPMCAAVVDYPAPGYNGILGWVQLVRSGDNLSQGREFEIDPLEFLGDVPHPFCWLGQEPRLFDAPSRLQPTDMEWLAHSWLCVPDGNSMDDLSVHALCGFSWGFEVAAGQVTLVPPRRLAPTEWDADVAVLTPRYPGWRFAPGWRSD